MTPKSCKQTFTVYDLYVYVVMSDYLSERGFVGLPKKYLEIIIILH